MKTRVLFLLIVFLSVISSVVAQVHVKGYYRKDGTYVKSHYRSSPDGNPYNNYSYPGNYNPYTGVTAKGSEEAYLRNYYRVYRTTPGYNYNYASYERLLRQTNYSNLKSNNSYVVNNPISNSTIGYIEPVRGTRMFHIFDVDKKRIGYIKTNKRGNRFSVHTLGGEVISTNKKNITKSIVGAIVLTSVLVVGILAAG